MSLYSLFSMPRGVSRRRSLPFRHTNAWVDVLEHSGIAWPNRRMFSKILYQKPNRPGPMGSRLPPGMVGGGLGGPPFREPRPVPAQQWRLQMRPISPYVALLDTHNTDQSWAYAATSDVGRARREFLRHMNEAPIEEIVQTLSPTRKDELIHALGPSKRISLGLEPSARAGLSLSATSSPTLQGRMCPSSNSSVFRVNWGPLRPQHKSIDSRIPQDSSKPRMVALHSAVSTSDVGWPSSTPIAQYHSIPHASKRKRSLSTPPTTRPRSRGDDAVTLYSPLSSGPSEEEQTPALTTIEAESHSTTETNLHP